MRKIAVFAIITLIVTSCQEKESVWQLYETQMERSIAFFEEAYSNDKGFYYSKLDENGKVISDKIHTVALSRMIYGLAYYGQFNEKYLDRAQKAAKFQLSKMIAADKDGAYYIPELSHGQYEQPQSFDIWQQAYGACGLTELYRHTQDRALLTSIHQLNSALIKRFQDKKSGGFYGEYKLDEGQVSGSKTIQSLMYPITALMSNLWLADSENRAIYEPIIKENLSIAYRCVWNDSLKWVNTRFDDNWNPVRGNDDVVSPGHNFQFAALLLRSKAWTFIPEEQREAYAVLGKTIVRETLAKKIWDKDQINQGFWEAINPHTNAIISKNKSWWQHCEALIALSFLKDEYDPEFKALHDFYFATFSDSSRGGEWAKVDEENKPVVEPKGQKGKSVYHHIEMIRFINE